MITFDAKRNLYLDADQVVPRVSSVVRLLDPDAFAMVKDSALAMAAQRGTWVHEAIDRFHTEGRWESNDHHVDSIVGPYIPGYLQFLSDTGAEPLEGEKVVSHRLYRYAGRLDKLYRVRGKLTVLDFKVTAAMPKTVWVQLAAYMEAENDGRRSVALALAHAGQHKKAADLGVIPGGLDRDKLITERAALRLRSDGKYDLRRPPEPFAEDLRVFLALLQIHNWKVKHANNDKPKF